MLWTAFLFLWINCQLLSATLCLNMIVKNEAFVIERCLSSVLPLIDYWIIVDTGSHDGTQEIIKKFMKQKGVAGELYERPWVNFAHNRNEALQLAQGKADYCLFIDADDYFKYDENFKKMPLTRDYYTIPISHGGLKYSRIHIIKNSLPWQWVGVVHEVLQPNVCWKGSQLEGITNIYSMQGSRSKDPLKYQKDAEILEEALIQDPHNTRTVFYLAQSYRDAGNYEKALANYHKRVALGGWEEEVYVSLLQIALIQEHINSPIEEVIASYKKAFCFRTSRPEPLIHLARLYRMKKDYLTGYLYAQYAQSMKPSTDVLFVDQSLIDNDLPLELSVNAYWLGYYEEFVSLTHQLQNKESLPNHIREIVQKNACFLMSTNNYK